MKCPQEEHDLKNWRDTDSQPRNILEMTLKMIPEHMNGLLILLVINERQQCGKGMKKMSGLKFASRTANISDPRPKYKSPVLSMRKRTGPSCTAIQGCPSQY
jgi:hypothetical protein